MQSSTRFTKVQKDDFTKIKTDTKIIQMITTLIKKHGKYMICTLLVAFLFSGCTESNVKEQSIDYIMDDTGGRLKTIEVDNCEYIFYEKGHRIMMAHKGNCKYCEKRSKR